MAHGARCRGEFGVARPTARAAINELAAARLPRHETHRGAFVPTLGDAAIRDLFRARGLLEVGAVRDLARRRHVPPAARAAVTVLTAEATSVEPDRVRS